MRCSLVTVALVTGALVAGCRSCAERGGDVALEAAGPTMPVGLLVPLPDAGPASRGSAAERLTLMRGLTREGAAQGWVELQLAAPEDTATRSSFQRALPDSIFVTVDAMTLLHEPFARALPGFDLFLPRLFDRDALARLRSELAAFRGRVAAMGAAVSAKAAWGEASTVIATVSDDAAWLDAREALLGTIDGLMTLIDSAQKVERGLWILGM